VVENSNIFDQSTENYILKNELENRLEASLESLPEDVAAAFRLNRYEGKKYHEIADIQKVSVRTIEVRIGKALSLLRENLKEYLTILLACIHWFHS
jgi:RNA polymerase sigma-70 factor (ECF subfamily)